MNRQWLPQCVGLGLRHTQYRVQVRVNGENQPELGRDTVPDGCILRRGVLIARICVENYHVRNSECSDHSHETQEVTLSSNLNDRDAFVVEVDVEFRGHFCKRNLIALALDEQGLSSEEKLVSVTVISDRQAEVGLGIPRKQLLSDL